MMRYSFLFLLLLFVSCKDSVPKQKLNLLKHGLPISIDAPEDALINSDDLGVMHDVTVKSGDDYFIQIYGSEAISIDAKQIFQDKKREIEAGPFFAEIVKEEENGMIYKKQIDENTEDFDFIYVKIQGDNEFIFQTGLMGTFTKEQVQEMYDSVK